MPSMRFNCAHLIFKLNMPQTCRIYLHTIKESFTCQANVFDRIYSGSSYRSEDAICFLLCFSVFFFFFLWFCICYVFLIELERETPNEWPLLKTRLLKQNHLNNLVVHSTINKDKVSIFQKDNTKSVNHLFLRVFQRYFTIQKFLWLNEKNEKDFFISSLTSLHLRFVFIKKMLLSFMCRRVHCFSTNFSFYVDKIRLGFYQGRSLDFSTGGGGVGGSNIVIPKLPT